MDGWRGVFSCMMEGGVCVVVEEEPRVSRWSGGGVVEWWWSMEPRCMDDDGGMRAGQKVCTHAHSHS